MKTIDEIEEYIKYRTLCPLPPECMELTQNIESKENISLDLSNQNLEDISFLRDYKNLKVLSLRRNKIKDISVLAELEQLEELDLSYNQIQDYSSLENLKNLKKVAPQKLSKYVTAAKEISKLSMQIEKIDNSWHKKIRNPRIEKSGFIFKKVSVTWDCITFGRYPQGKVSPMRQHIKSKLVEDTNYQLTYTYKTDSGQEERYCKQSYNYYKVEPICWRVLRIKDGKALLFADKILDAIPFDSVDKGESSQWKTSFAYRYLNSIGLWANKQMANSTFLKMAFSEKERKAIIERESGYVSFLPYSAITDVKFSSYGLYDLFSKNKLSIDPLKTQIYSDYAEAKKLKCSVKLFSTGAMSGTAPWWLDSHSISNYNLAHFVDHTGKISHSSYLWNTLGVRPVIEVDLSMLEETDVQITTVTIE